MDEEQKRETAPAMRIQRARPDQLDRILEIYAHARVFMAEHGNPTQWGTFHPPAEQVRQDIREGLSFVCMAREEIVAVFYFRIGDDPTYHAIYEGQWLNDRPYGVVHRIASAGTVRGAGSFCLQWALEQCGNLRIDTHRNNVVMQNMLKKNGFSYCGIIYLEDGDERLAFQKTLEKSSREKAPLPTGLVLEGGGMRGIYTAGVLDVFMEEGIVFDGVLGVSAGAIHGCSYVSGQKGRSIRYYKKYCKDKRFMSFSNAILHGELVDTQFAYHDVPEHLDPYDYEAFRRSKTKFYVGCSNLETGRPECVRITDMKAQIDAVRASASLPYMSHTVEYEGKKMLDGGCTDSIPLRSMLKLGYKRNVVVLTRDIHYVKKPEHSSVARVFYRRYPRFVAALKRRHITYNKTVRWIRKLELEGKVFVIRPSRKLTISRTSSDPDELQRVYDLGRADARRQMEDMKRFLGK